MRKCVNKITAAVLALLTAAGIAFSGTTPVLADQERYLALGADLTTKQKQTVEELLGVEDESLYEITYVTNDEEYESLGAYISADQIGTKALSSAVVVSRGKGEGITVTTNNITYCTPDMYKNALITAGVSDVSVSVAGPSPISGTAALVGITKIYSDNIADEPLNQDNIDAANDELATTQELGQSIGEQEASDLIATLKQLAIELGSRYSTEDISSAIDTYSEENDITITDTQKNKILELIDRLQQVDIDPDKLQEQAKDIYTTVRQFLDDNPEVKEASRNVFASLWNLIVTFFKSIFGTSSS